jgi:hypothetical protein
MGQTSFLTPAGQVRTAQLGKRPREENTDTAIRYLNFAALRAERVFRSASDGFRISFAWGCESHGPTGHLNIRVDLWKRVIQKTRQEMWTYQTKPRSSSGNQSSCIVVIKLVRIFTSQIRLCDRIRCTTLRLHPSSQTSVFTIFESFTIQ